MRKVSEQGEGRQNKCKGESGVKMRLLKSGSDVLGLY
jgi:hypothetical protein